MASMPQSVRIRGDKDIPIRQVVDIRLLRPSDSPTAGLASPRPAGQLGQSGQPKADSVTEEQRARLRKLVADADELFKAGQLDQAAAKLEEVRKLAPGAVAQMRMLARLYRQLGRPDKADPIEKSLPPPEPPRLTAAQADEALTLVNRLAAEEARYGELRGLDPEDVTHQAQRKQMLAQAGRDVQSARDAIDQWKRKNNRPGDSQSLVRDLARRAEDLLGAGKADLAMSLLTDLREVAPQNAPVLRALVRAYDRTGQRDQADEVRRMINELTNSRLTDSRADVGRTAPAAPAGPLPKSPVSHS
jgi:tetratricopeptide (TPR) repeat protein